MESFRIVHATDVIELTVGGALDVERSRALLLRVVQANAEAGLDLLLDLRPAYDAGIPFREVHALTEILRDHPDAFRGKLALLDRDRPGFEKVQFFQASAAQHGFEVRAFLDFERAARWLQQASPLDPDDPPAHF